MNGLKRNTLVFRHEKNCWTVDLLSDGTIVATSNYKRKVNIQHRIPSTMLLIPDSTHYLPEYVIDMLFEARFEWIGEVK